jgi:hypothetical protein
VGATVVASRLWDVVVASTAIAAVPVLAAESGPAAGWRSTRLTPAAGLIINRGAFRRDPLR